MATGGPRPTSGPQNEEAMTAQKHILHEELIQIPTILDYKKKKSEIYIEVILIFMIILVKEFEAKFQDFTKIGKVFKFFKLAFEAAPAAELIGVATELFIFLKTFTSNHGI